MKYFIMLAALLLLTVPAFGEENMAAGTDGDKKSEDLDEVVVTATRTERPAEKVPAAVTAVTSDEIKDTRMFGIKEALTGISGVQSESKNGGYDSRLIIRGAGLKARYGVREIMILLDGVPITDPDGMSRLDFVDTQLVDRIDVVKGPNSTLYGANAAGGVINILTKTPFEESKFVKAAYGSYNTQMYNATYSNRVGENYFTMSGSWRSTNSWRNWNKFSTAQSCLKLGHVFEDGATVEGVVSYTNARLQLPGALTKAQFEKDITQTTSEIWRHSVRNSEIVFTNLKYEKEFGNLKLKPMVFFENWSHYHPVTGMINDGGANVYGADLQADLKHRIAWMEGTLTGGVTGQIDDSDGKKYQYADVVKSGTGRILFTTTNTKGQLAETDDDTVSKWGVYLQESLKPLDNLVVDTGIRYDQVRFDMDDHKFSEFNYATARYVVTNSVTKRKKTFDYVSPRIGAVYTLFGAFNLYGNVSTGFQTPQESELSTNADLKPMKALNYEGGLKARLKGGHSLDVAYFYMTNKDEVVQVTSTPSFYGNAGRTKKQGVEVSGQLQLIDGLSAGGSYTYSDFRFERFDELVSGVPKNRDGNRLPYIPRHQYSLFAAYRHPIGLRLKVDTNSWGKYFVDNANTETYTGYDFLTNLLVGYTWKKLDVAFTVYNVFDKRYAMEVTKDPGAKKKYRPGSPVSYMLQLAYNF